MPMFNSFFFIYNLKKTSKIIINNNYNNNIKFWNVLKNINNSLIISYKINMLI